jgi:sugar-phosphatase
MGLSISASPVHIFCKGILFDMDGILISSLGSVERSWTKWSLMRGINPEKALKVIHGRRSIESIALLRPDLDAQSENLLIEQLEIDDTDGVEALPGALTLLDSLPPSRWTVVTSATEPLARVRLGRMGIPIPEKFVTAESVTQGKPHPAPYRAGAKLLGLAPEECVVFEDAGSGTKAGRAAGCTVIATTFSHTAEELSSAHYLIPDLTAVSAEVAQDGGAIMLRFTPLGA